MNSEGGLSAFVADQHRPSWCRPSLISAPLAAVLMVADVFAGAYGRLTVLFRPYDVSPDRRRAVGSAHIVRWAPFTILTPTKPVTRPTKMFFWVSKMSIAALERSAT